MPSDRKLVLEPHVIAYLGDYMIHMKNSLRNYITQGIYTNSTSVAPSQTSQSNTSSSHHKS